MSTQAYGSITIVDIGDLGELSVTPESNLPTMVVYSPDNQTYNPDWSGNPYLKIVPVIYYGNLNLINSSSTSIPTGLTITWKKQIGNNTPTDITSSTAGHTITSGGALQVSANQLSISNPLITYIVEVNYYDSTIGIPSTNALYASGLITYGLIQNASTVKMITVSGAGAFLYNSSNVCQNSPITLTASATGVTVSKWLYKNGSSWTDISGATSSTLSIAHNASYFTGDTLIVRALGSDNTTFDEHNIVKVRDGAPGDLVVSAVLTNEDLMIPCDKDGAPIGTVSCPTQLVIYAGNSNITNRWTITPSTTNVSGTGSWASGSSAYNYTVTSISDNTGYVTFTCTHSQYNPLSKSFLLVKVKAGADGTNGTSPTIYTLEVDALAVNKDINSTCTPSVIHLNAYSQTGSNARQAYTGQFKIFLDGNSTAVVTSTSSAYTYTVPSTVNNYITTKLYNSAGSTLYDTQTTVITFDGATGSLGAGGLNFVLGNYSDLIPCTSAGVVAGSTDIVKDITFAAYLGTSQVYCTAAVSGTVANKITTSITQNSKIAVTYKAGTDLGSTSTDQGTLTITLTAKTSSNGDTLGSQTFTYTWVKNKLGANGTNGQNAVLFQLYTPNGNVVSNNENNITVSPLLLDGNTDKTATAQYTWWYYANGSYNNLITSTSSSDSMYISGTNLIIKPTAVDSYLSIKCIASYSSKTYTAYQSIYDKTDIFQITVLSTLGDKLVNSVGTGIIYTKVLRNGEPYDEIKSTAVATSNAAASFNNAVALAGVTGTDPSNYCWYATSTSLSLYHKSGTSWSAVSSASDPHIATYSWTGLHISDNTNATIYGYGKNKAILLNGAIVNKKTMFNVTMTVT